MAILLADSVDFGHHWSDWRKVEMPGVPGPPSLTNPILKLADGRLAMSIETNKDYGHGGKWRQRAVFLLSADQGRNWSAPISAAEDPTTRIFNWDLRCCVAPDGRIASFAWTYDTNTRRYPAATSCLRSPSSRDIMYATLVESSTSFDEGRGYSAP